MKWLYTGLAFSMRRKELVNNKLAEIVLGIDIAAGCLPASLLFTFYYWKIQSIRKLITQLHEGFH